MFRTILLELFLKYRPYKKTANIRQTTISAQILHQSQTTWRDAPKRKTGAAAKHLLKRTADSTALQSQIDWTSNHGTIERKISNRSRIWSAAGWCPAAINNNFARASRFFVHFFTVNARLRRENALFHVLCRKSTKDDDFLFLFLKFNSLLEFKSRKNCQHLRN